MSGSAGEPVVILVADDDDDVRELIGFRLEHAGYEVVEAPRMNARAPVDVRRLGADHMDNR